MRAIAGRDVKISCPYSGYPVTLVKWSRGGSPMPHDLRHKLDNADGHLAITDVSVDDHGVYTCTVHSGSETASRDIQVEVQSECNPLFPPSLESTTRGKLMLR